MADDSTATEGDDDRTLVEQVEDLAVDDVPVPESVPVKKRRRLTVYSEDQEVLCEQTRTTITEAFRGAYESTSSADLAPFCKQIKMCFQKLRKSCPNRVQQDFYNEIFHRLNFIVESNSQLDQRHASLRMIIIASLKILYELKSETLVDVLIEYIYDCEYCDEASVRQNVCAMIGMYFHYWKSFDAVKKRTMPAAIRDKLYKILRRRQLDKAAVVRAEVIRAVRTIQLEAIPSDFKDAIERSPKEIILMGLRDIAPECRLAAVQTLDVSENLKEHISDLIDMATSDKANKVRIAALHTLGKINPSELSGSQMMDLLQCVLFDCDKAIKKAAIELVLNGWITTIAGALKKKYLKNSQDGSKQKDKPSEFVYNYDQCHGFGVAAQLLIGKMDWINEPDLVSSIYFIALDSVRTLLGRGYQCTVNEMIPQLMYDPIEPRPIVHSNYQNILNEKLTPVEQALQAFCWRCMIQYCEDITEKEVDRHSCSSRLCPTLTTMCDVARRIRNLSTSFDTVEEEVDALSMKEISLREILKICTFLDREDDFGLKEWKKMLEEQLSDMSLSKGTTDTIMMTLLNVHYKDDPLGALDSVTNIAAALVDRDINPDATLMNETVALSANMTLRPNASKEADECITNYCMQVLNSILKTGAFKTMNPILMDKYDNLVQRSIVSTNQTVRQWAIEAMAIISMMDEKIAETSMIVIIEAFKIDVESVKLICLDAICDWCIHYGYEKVNSWTDVYEQIVQIYYNIIIDNNPEPEMCRKACECGAKLLLLRARDPEEAHWVHLITCMAMRLFHPSANKLPSLKACLSQFFLIFSSIRKSNQMMLINLFTHLLDVMRDPTSAIAMKTKVEVQRALVCVTKWTRDCLLVNRIENDEVEETAHCILLTRILSFLEENPDDDYIRLYCQCAAVLDLDGISSERITELRIEYQSAYELISDVVGEKSRSATELKKLIKRMEIVCNQMIFEDEAEDVVGDLPGTPMMKKRFGSTIRSQRKKPMSTIKKATVSASRILKRTATEEAGSISDDPSEAGSTATVTRQILPRTAKRQVRNALFRD